MAVSPAIAAATALLIEAGIGAQRLGRGEIGDQHVDRPVGAGLQDELAVEFERGAEQHGEHDGLGQQPRDRLRIVVAGEDLVEQRPELDAAAAHVERADLEGHDMVVAGKAEFTELSFCIEPMHQTPGSDDGTRSERAAFDSRFAGDEPLR